MYAYVMGLQLICEDITMLLEKFFCTDRTRAGAIICVAQIPTLAKHNYVSQ
jgi:hypothetical protein